MKSPALNRQLQSIFGDEGEARLFQGLERLEAREPELVSGLRRLIHGADAACAQYAFIQQALAELGGDVLSEWNLRSGRIESGRQWKTLLGYPLDALEDSVAAWQGLLHGDDVVLVRAAIAAHVRGERSSLDVECRMRTREGAWCWLQVRGKISARDEQGNALRLLLLHRNITVRRATETALVAAKEAAEAANRARGAFLANMSHEIRTPLNGVIGMTELALDTELDSEQRHYLKTVKSSAESLLALLNDILDFSKIEAGKLQFETISFSPAAVLQEAARTVAVSAHRKGLELVVGVGRDVPSRVVGDPTRLRQVFLNLLGNGIKFTERGEVEARVELERLAEASVVLRCSVRDTGIGIAPERQAEVFEAFSQGDSSTTRRFGGTGLGLAICARLVQLMDGRMDLESQAGQGSTFTFTARMGREEAAVPAAGQGQSFSGLRALLQEPNDTAAGALGDCLQGLGVAVSRVRGAEEAAQALVRARELDYPFAFLFAQGDAGLVPQWLQQRPPEKLVLLLKHEQAREGLDALQAAGLGACLLKPVVAEDVQEVLSLLQGSSGFDLAPIDLQTQVLQETKRLEVLLVEDNPVNQELARRLLERRGHRVTLANHGGEALELFEQQRFDVIFMDMQMPVMGGLEATEAIRAKELRRSWVVSGDYHQVPIVAMTANAMAGDRARCLEAGMNDYLTKPLRLDELDRVLEGLQDCGGAGFPEPGGGNGAVLDLEAAEQDLGDRELLRQMGRMLLEEWPTHLAGLNDALQGRKGRDLCRHAHTLKSLVAIFHGDRARRAAQALEQTCQNEAAVDWSEALRLSQELQLALEEMKPELERFAGAS